MAKAYLVLSDGTVFEGERFGADCDMTGELVFNTGMVGYIETLTDPSYYGQMITFTSPHIGNVGMIEADFEGECHIRGCVVRCLTENPSNFRSQYDLDTFLKQKGVPGIYGVDTRQITRRIRTKGVINARICSEIPENLEEIINYRITDAVKNSSVSHPEVLPAEGGEKYRVTLIDYGAKHNIVHELRARGCQVTVVPYNTTAEEILTGKPDGVMLTNGPGDPTDNVEAINTVQNLIGKVPMFGICLGHQITALAEGGKTRKMKFGHRGMNQSVRDLSTGRVYISSQNHGYEVDPDNLPPNGRLSWENANDMTVEGIDYPGLKAFTVQFHPEACPGRWDTLFLFDKFIELMEKERYKPMRDYGKELENRIKFIQNAIKTAHCDGIVFGNSGGKDSALVGILCKKACDNTVGIIMPCSSKRNMTIDKDDGMEVADAFAIETRLIDLTATKEKLMAGLGDLTELNSAAVANIAPRLRMTTLYAVAASENRLVAGTGNRSEAYMGYFTKWGDGAYDLNPIADLTVTEIYEFLRYLNAPEAIITKAPSAGLFDGQTDESEMGITYNAIDRYLLTGEATDEDKKVLDRYHGRSDHKRRPALVYTEE